MNINKIDEFLDKEIERIKDYYNSKSEEELTLTMTLKIGEKVGELFDEFLAHKEYQRKEKLDKKEIEKEIADVIFTTLILSRRMNIDIEKATEEKTEKVKKRGYK